MERTKGVLEDIYAENEIFTRHGERRVIVWNNTVMRHAQGNVIGVASIGVDITERKQMEQELLQAEKLATVGQLASGLAHEIGTSLGVISGTAELRSHFPSATPLGDLVL